MKGKTVKFEEALAAMRQGALVVDKDEVIWKLDMDKNCFCFKTDLNKWNPYSTIGNECILGEWIILPEDKFVIVWDWAVGKDGTVCALYRNSTEEEIKNFLSSFGYEHYWTEKILRSKRNRSVILQSGGLDEL